MSSIVIDGYAPSETGIKPLYAPNPTNFTCNVWHDVYEGFEYYVDVTGFKKDELSVFYDAKTRSVSVNGLRYAQDGEITIVKTINEIIKLPDEAFPLLTTTVENNKLRICAGKNESNTIRIL